MSTTCVAPLTSITEPASSAIVPCLACRVTLPPADSVPCTNRLSLGVATNVPRAAMMAVLPISSVGSAAVLFALDGTAPVSAMLMAPPGACTRPSMATPETPESPTLAPTSASMPALAWSLSVPALASVRLVGWRWLSGSCT